MITIRVKVPLVLDNTSKEIYALKAQKAFITCRIATPVIITETIVQAKGTLKSTIEEIIKEAIKNIDKFKSVYENGVEYIVLMELLGFIFYKITVKMNLDFKYWELLSLNIIDTKYKFIGITNCLQTNRSIKELVIKADKSRRISPLHKKMIEKQRREEELKRFNANK